MNFSQKTLQYVHAGSTVLDLGAGDGWFSRECVAKQARVTAVDIRPPQELHSEIDWHTMDIKNLLNAYQNSNFFDVMYSRNLIQFLDNDWVREKLFPVLIEHIAPHGIIALQTFYQDPEPPFETKLSSLFTVDDLTTMLPTLNIVHERQFSETSPDMKGVQRTFFVTNIVAQQ